MKYLIAQINRELSKGRSVLLDFPADSSNLLDKLCTVAENSQSVKFEGVRKGVFYHSEYISPCNKFNEIKRIILATNDAKGLRKDFNGILMLDISEWLTHESENYFSILLKFLYDKNSHWKYVFVISANDKRKRERLHLELLKIFRCSLIGDRTFDTSKDLIERVALRENVVFDTDAASELIAYCNDSNLSEHVIENLVSDIICETQDPVIKAVNIKKYFLNPSCIYSNLYTDYMNKKGSAVRE